MRDGAEDSPRTVRVRGESGDGRRGIVVASGRQEIRVQLRGPFGPGSRCADPAAVLGLLAAMAGARPLEVEGPVSPRLLGGIGEAQAALSAWNPALSRVAVLATPREVTAQERAAGVAAFFSGGVDSFYTALGHRDELTDLIFIHGYDIGLGEDALRERAAAGAAEVAARLGLGLVEVETDVRDAIDPYLGWGMAHGFALAAVALSLQERFGRVLVPASFSYASMVPWGTHPLLDPLWSTESTEIVHSDFGVERAAKIAAVAASDTALAHLRVCWENRGGAYNCGRCEKCVRTMLGLRAAGALERCPTFAAELTPAAVRALPLVDPVSRIFARDVLAALEARGGERELVAALRTALRRSQGLPGAARRVHRRARLLHGRLRR